MSDVEDRLHLEEGDITRLAVDAIVNAANERLTPGGGVSGAIHRAAGRGLAAECRTVAPCPTGEARITRGHGLPARHVIHVVGPVWHGAGQGEPEQLARCYRNALALAAEHGIETVAFPAISTGIFGYPLEAATEIAVTTVRQALAEHPGIAGVTFCTFGAAVTRAYRGALKPPS